LGVILVTEYKPQSFLLGVILETEYKPNPFHLGVIFETDNTKSNQSLLLGVILETENKSPIKGIWFVFCPKYYYPI
jgi:hypothetical protein